MACLLVGCGSGRSAGPRSRTLEVVAAGTTLLRVAVPGEAGSAARTTRAVVARLPHELRTRRGRASVELRIPAGRAAAALERSLRSGETRVALPVVPVASAIALRPLRQVLHNNCEAAALSMVLAAAGVRVGQLRLQAQLPQAEPIDPRGGIWGDPELGFVGRADGGGPAGGFGVYEPPVRALAARHGVRLDDLRGKSVATVRAMLLAGRPVLAWVGLADGPYLSWRTPAGRRVTANLNEHAVVLVGAGPGYVLVNDPLLGKRVRWSEGLFSVRWRRLGRRALALPLR